ncbi:MAG: threonine/serine exporter family protein [Tissierellia bacterium]|nr:threonine/serine exporter family protein [Tissierellia bacterium]
MYKTIDSESEAMLLLEVTSTACQLMLKNGAEVYRVEDTGERIIRSKTNIKDVEVYATFNVVMISFNFNKHIFTSMKKIKTRTNNLMVVDAVNTFSREYVLGKTSLSDALDELYEIKKGMGYKEFTGILGGAAASSLYCALFLGDIYEMIAAFFVAFISQYLTSRLAKRKLSFFVDNFFSGFCISCFAILIVKMNSKIDIDKVIIGSIMPFVPGLAMTNAVRDLMSGDSTTGITGAMNAIIIATALACGVAFPLSLYLV